MTIGRRTFAGALLFVPAMAAGCAVAAAQPSPATPPGQGAVEALDTYLQKQTAAGAFSGTVMVTSDHRRLLAKAYGLADREHNIPNTERTKFCIASMGKMFTAVAIGQLVQAGKLSFTDTVGKYLPSFPANIGNTVTIAQLLTHTSGLDDVALAPGPDGTPAPTTLAGQMKLIYGEPLQFTPGTKYSYSNDGFIVLGAIVQVVTGGVYADYIRHHVFDPSGMRDTDIRVYKPVDVPGMAHGYALVGTPPAQGSPPPGSQYQDISDRLQIGNPSGGAISTVGDMVQFADALMDNRLLSPQMTTKVLAPEVSAQQPGGPPGEMYGYGFLNQTVNNIRIVGHNGGTPGYSGQLDIYLTGHGYRVVMLTNQDYVMVPAIQESERLLTATH